MTRITHEKEWEQYKEHKYEVIPNSEDKAYRTFLNTITDNDGVLNKLGKDEKIPEEIIEINRVFDPLENKEYLNWDIIQWGFMEDGTKISPIHIQDLGMYKLFLWEKKSNPLGVFTGSPQKKTFKESIVSYEFKYFLDFNKKNLDDLKKKSKPTTRLYVYDVSKSGRGGKSGRIAVDNMKDFEERSFLDLIEGNYLLQTKLQRQMEALKMQQQALDLERKSMEINSKQTK